MNPKDRIYQWFNNILTSFRPKTEAYNPSPTPGMKFTTTNPNFAGGNVALVSPKPSSVPTPTPTPVSSPSVLGQYNPTPTPNSVGGRSYGRNPDTTKASNEVYNAITSAAKKYNVEPALLFDIAMQESSLNPYAQNSQGSAGGLFQYLDSTWNNTMKQYANNPKMSLYGVLPNQNKMDPVTNALVTAYLVGHGQLGKWDESKNVWGNFWPESELKKLGYYSQTLDRR